MQALELEQPGPNPASWLYHSQVLLTANSLLTFLSLGLSVKWG